MGGGKEGNQKEKTGNDPRGCQRREREGKFLSKMVTAETAGSVLRSNENENPQRKNV